MAQNPRTQLIFHAIAFLYAQLKALPELPLMAAVAVAGENSAPDCSYPVKA